MLVLTRRVGEEIIINGNVRVVVLAARGERLRLGITAPASVRIDRSEVHDRRGERPAESDREESALVGSHD